MASRGAIASGDDWEDLDDVVVVDDAKRPTEDRQAARTDGPLFLSLRRSQQHAYAQAQLIDQVSAYAAAHGLLWCARPTLRLGDRGFAEPDVVVTMRGASVRLAWAPTAILEIEDTDTPCAQMIEKAAMYLTHLASVECVVCFKLLAPHPRLLQDHRQLRVPAVAFVFCRGLETKATEARSSGLCLVRVTQSCSFGNEAVDPTVLECFRLHTAHHLLENPLRSVNHLTVASAVLSDGIDSAKLEASLCESLSRVQTEETNAVMEIPMAAPLPVLCVDLPKVFVAAMLGWGLDVADAAETGEDADWCAVPH